jgi:hypothetical protein
VQHIEDDAAARKTLAQLRRKLLTGGAWLLLLCPALASGQTLVDINSRAASDAITLPDEPLPSTAGVDPVPLAAESSSSSSTAGDTNPQTARPTPANRPAYTREASPFAKYVQPNQPAPRLTNSDKFVMGFLHSVTPFAALGWITAATYEQITDGPPNYGQSGKGYVQRSGAAAARGTADNVFTDSILSPIFHEDPRYYKQGRQHQVAYRIVYAVTRTFITRTDGGANTLNLALLLGNLGSTALTQAYYPPINRGFLSLARNYGDSLGGSALGFTVSEFLNQALEILHMNLGRFQHQ